MSKYILNALYSTGDERKEFNSLDGAIEFARALLDTKGKNFAGIDATPASVYGVGVIAL